jgi:hypothetical protein
MDPNLKQPDSKFFIGTHVMGFLTVPIAGPVTKIEYEQGRVFYEVTYNNEKFKLEEKYLKPFEPTCWYSVLDKWNEYLRIGMLQQKLLHETVEMMRPVR